MSTPTPSQLFRRLAPVFAVSVAILTGLLLANNAVRRLPELTARDVPAGTIVEMLLLSLPHILALTIPMAVFIAVTCVFMRLGAEGVLAAAMHERHGVRRLVVPVLAAAAVLSTLTLVSNTQVLPRTNARLAELFAGAPVALSDRTMTVGELREAARSARTSTGVIGAARAAAYDVEIQKKFALAAACVFLMLAGVATAIRFPHAGVQGVVAASGLVFIGYYFAVTAGESLADRQMMSPWIAMWLANALLLGAALLLVWRSDDSGGERLAVGT